MKTHETNLTGTSEYDYINGLETPRQRYEAALKMMMATAGVDMVDLELAAMIADDGAEQTDRLLAATQELGSEAVGHEAVILAMPSEERPAFAAAA